MNGAAVIAEILRREGTEFLSCYPRNPADRGLRRARHPHHPVPAGARRRRHCRWLSPDPPRPPQRRVRRPGRSRHRECLPRHRPGLFRERSAAGHSGRVAAGAPLPPSGVPRRRCLSPGHQVVGAGSFGAGAARPDAARLSRVAQRQGRARAGRDSDRGMGGRISRARSTTPRCRCSASRPIRTPSAQAVPHAAGGAKARCCWAGQGVLYADAGDRLAALAELVPAPVVTTNPGKGAIPESHPLALGASTRSRPKMFTEFMARADLVLAIGSSLTQHAVRSGHPPRARPSSIPPTMPPTSTRNTGSTMPWLAMPRWCSTR